MLLSASIETTRRVLRIGRPSSPLIGPRPPRAKLGKNHVTDVRNRHRPVGECQPRRNPVQLDRLRRIIEENETSVRDTQLSEAPVIAERGYNSIISESRRASLNESNTHTQKRENKKVGTRGISAGFPRPERRAEGTMELDRHRRRRRRRRRRGKRPVWPQSNNHGAASIGRAFLSHTRLNFTKRPARTRERARVLE